MTQLASGHVVAHRYRIQRLVGVGGMGSVYEAIDVTTSQRRALKVLHPQFLNHPVIPKRFLQEAAAARALVTPYAVKVDGTGTLEDGSPYLVMEFLDGVDLGEVMRRAGGRLVVERALVLVDQVAEALQEAHARGIIHRDLKPENIFVQTTASGELAKVVDFGISKLLSRDDGAKLTQTGTTLGTPHYMPIEQLRGAKDLDGRVDVYALGVILYQVLAGVRPFDGNTYEEVILKVATSSPRPLIELRPDLPPGLLDVVTQAMASDRDRRIPTMQDLRSLIAPYRGPRSTPPFASTPSHVPSMPPNIGTWSSPPDRVSSPMPSTLPSPPRKSKVGWVVLAVVVIVAGIGSLFVVGGAGAWWYWSDSAVASPSPAAVPSSGTSVGAPSGAQAKPPSKR